MMKLIHCAVLSVLMCFGTTSGMAAPEDTMPSREDLRSSYKKEEQRHGGAERGGERMHKMSIERRSFHAESSWKTGASISNLPNAAPSQQAVDYSKYPQLSTPSRYQKWIKVDGHFILINVMTNTILKVIPE